MNAAALTMIASLASNGMDGAEEILDDSLSVGAEVIRPFGGKLKASQQRAANGGLSVGADIGGGASNGNYNTLMGILAAYGGRPCQVRGEPMPAGDCARRLCLTQLFYGVTVTASATGQTYTLTARDWFLPLAWVDYSASTVSIVSVTFKTDPLFDSNTTFVPSAAFPAASNWNFVIGIPAFSSTNGYVFTLANSAAAGAAFAGKLIGIAVRG